MTDNDTLALSLAVGRLETLAGEFHKAAEAFPTKFTSRGRELDAWAQRIQNEVDLIKDELDLADTFEPTYARWKVKTAIKAAGSGLVILAAVATIGSDAPAAVRNAHRLAESTYNEAVEIVIDAKVLDPSDLADPGVVDSDPSSAGQTATVEFQTAHGVLSERDFWKRVLRSLQRDTQQPVNFGYPDDGDVAFTFETLTKGEVRVTITVPPTVDTHLYGYKLVDNMGQRTHIPTSQRFHSSDVETIATHIQELYGI